MEGKTTVARATVAHRSAGQDHLRRTQSVLTRILFTMYCFKSVLSKYDFEYPQLTRVVKCELNTWEWQNSKVVSATLCIPYESTLLMQDTHYPTSNLVIPQLHQMISRLQMPNITYVHTAQRETISICEALEKGVMPEKMKVILRVRTQMVESIYKYFDLD